GIITCSEPINSGPQHFILNAAFIALDRWVTHGRAPKPAPRLDVSAGPPVTIAQDAFGNAIGGIRTPQVDVPIAAFGGLQPASLVGALFWVTTPLCASRTDALLPRPQSFV